MNEFVVLHWDELKEESQQNLQKAIVDQQVESYPQICYGYTFGSNQFEHRGVVLMHEINYVLLAEHQMDGLCDKTTYILHPNNKDQDPVHVKKMIEKVMSLKAFL